MHKISKTGEWTGEVSGGAVMKDYQKEHPNAKSDTRSVCAARIRIMPLLFKGNLITFMRECFDQVVASTHVPALLTIQRIHHTESDQWLHYGFTNSATGQLTLQGDFLRVCPCQSTFEGSGPTFSHAPDLLSCTQFLVHKNPHAEFFGDEKERREEMLEKVCVFACVCICGYTHR